VLSTSVSEFDRLTVITLVLFPLLLLDYDTLRSSPFLLMIMLLLFIISVL